MNINIIYISTFIISIIILYLIKIDIYKFKKKLYNEIDKKIWYKIYIIFTIFLIHLVWLINILFFNYTNKVYNNKFDKYLVYGFPFILLIPYLIYGFIDFNVEFENDSIVSNQLDKYLNNCFTIYLFIIIILIILPNDIKEKPINFIKKYIS